MGDIGKLLAKLERARQDGYYLGDKKKEAFWYGYAEGMRVAKKWLKLTMEE